MWDILPEDLKMGEAVQGEMEKPRPRMFPNRVRLVVFGEVTSVSSPGLKRVTSDAV